jgi:hypothetical protein
MGRGIERKQIFIIAAEIIRNMSKKGRHWDDDRNWLVVDWSEAWGAGRKY